MYYWLILTINLCTTVYPKKGNSSKKRNYKKHDVPTYIFEGSSCNSSQVHYMLFHAQLGREVRKLE